MKDLQGHYMDCCDRLFLNDEAQKKMSKGNKVLEEQIEKDKMLKAQIESIFDEMI